MAEVKANRSECGQQDVKNVFLTATEQGDAEQVRKLLEEHSIEPDLTAMREGIGRSVLSVAATYGQTSIISELLKGGANPVLKSGSQRVALHEACIGGHLESVRLLVDATSDINVGDINGQTAAHLAAFHGETKVLKLLLDKGANMTATDNKGRQPAHLSATRNHKPILQLLFKCGVDLDSQCNAGKTPLHYAAQYGSYEALVYLIERNSDLTVRDVHLNLPLHHAARHDKLRCLQFLIKHGTSVNITQAEGRASSHIAALSGSVNVLHWLLDTDADANLVDNHGNTPLHYAAEGGKAESFNCCLQHDASLSAVNKRGDTPLDAAKKYGHRLLMEKALKNEVVCPLCLKKCEKLEYERKHAPALVERSITSVSMTAYTSPLPAFQRTSTQHQKNLLKANMKKKAIKQNLRLGRDLAAKYFGDHLDSDGSFQFTTK
ncbi:hypothetical protein BsWGS_07942 [Bradybaena similaris]